MSLLQITYRVQGPGVERLLDELKANGVALYDVNRLQPRCVQFSCALSQSKAAEGIAARLGFVLKEQPPRGLLRRLRRLRTRALLGAGLLIAAVCLLIALQFVWRIEISGAGVYLGEVRALLREEGVTPGILRRAVDVQKLCDAIAYRLPRIAWARAQVRGVTLYLDITRGVPMPALESGGAAGDVVAACDGVIDSIQVYSGTAAVKAGDTVRAGQVLIYGRERATDESAVPVPARGRVTGRVWRQAQAALSAVQTDSAPTGRNARQTVVAMPWLRLSDQPEPDFLSADIDISILPLGGAWLPVWLEKIVYQEVALTKTERDPAALQAEAGALAMQKLLFLCDINDEMIDKKLNFSMIEGETILATATAELLTDIGRFQPYSSK